MNDYLRALATRTESLKQSDIRAVTQRINEAGGINLGQGICDLPTPQAANEAAKDAIDQGHSIYTSYAGIEPMREAVAEKARTYNGLPVESPDDVMITAGSTGAYVTALLALTNPGDEIVLFEPFYGYHRNIAQLFDLSLRYVTTRPPDWRVTKENVESAVSDRTKILLINTPGNPSGKVWSRDELQMVLEYAEQHDAFVVTDEIYEYMVYDDHEHLSPGSLPGAYERTITLSGLSKTYNMTGWRLGYAVGPAQILEKMGLINDLLYICAPAPLQHGGVGALSLGDEYFSELRKQYDTRRTMMCEALERCGFDVPWPQGAYYVFAQFGELSARDGFSDDREASQTLIEQAGVATVPGRSFFQHPEDGSDLLRFCFAKELPELQQACDQLVEAFG